MRIDSEKDRKDIFEDRENELFSNSILKKAQEAEDENREEVRAMTNIVLKCKVDSIRNKQIQLKRQEQHKP